MDDAETTLQLPASLRQLQPTALQAIHHPGIQAHQQQHQHHNHHNHQPHHHAHGLGSQLPPELQGLDPSDPNNAFQQRLQAELGDPTAAQAMPPAGAFDHHPAMNSAHQNVPPQTPQHQHNSGPFGVLTPMPNLGGPSHPQHRSIDRVQQEPDIFQTPDRAGKDNGHSDEFKIVPNPPSLAEWRTKLFDVNDTITLSEDECVNGSVPQHLKPLANASLCVPNRYFTYFPHVDNIYSHRSTQKYKRKPFISHYWDCRLKGRPPGTPKSDDPNKKKRKRTARQRDLCDVKIKITEYFPQSVLPQGFANSSPQPQMESNNTNNFFAPGQPGGPPLPQQQPPYGLLEANGSVSMNQPLASERYFTIQRVNGNGGNGKGDGVAGPHKHSLEDSDRVKKNSVQRHMLKEEKEKKKTQKTYHKRASGLALSTVKKHSKEHELKLYGSCFCPFVQRVWIALEAKGMQYQYIETDPYKKPDSLLEVNPRGLVPALRHGDWGCYESNVLLEYLEDCSPESPLLPAGQPQLRAHCRLWSDHINRQILPRFYRCLQAQETDKQIQYANELKQEISKLVEAADVQGPFFLGPNLSFVDAQFAPWMLRLSRVLKPYRGWPDAEPNTRWDLWLKAIESNEAVKATTSTDDLYLDSYERYSENRPNTSQLANAINIGIEMP
ncbi:MAG: hypothetical protein M4579_003733 [Chaenotheca gracillima]|nr:MAG: hypothetical protein M4579_003733 [Chaenotheca gracillima]